jgi:hypothetical protein
MTEQRQTLDDIAENDEITIKEKTELGEVFENLDHDTEDQAGQSKIDFNTRLSSTFISAIGIFDELRDMGISEGKISNKRKRLNVSLDGKGRTEKVTISSATVQRRESAGMLGGLVQPKQ